MIKNYIKENISRNNRGYTIHNKPIVVIDSLPQEIDMNYISKKIEDLIPNHLMYSIDMIYVGDFPFLKDRQINALYKDNAIYTTNDQQNNEDIIDDIVHEISHALEEIHGDEIYFDDAIEQEFLGKRTRLKSLLNYHDYLNSEYSKELDRFFFEDVGYSILNALTEGLFASAYGATSLREYFANGFEEYILGDRKYLDTISPKLYQKIYNIYNSYGEKQQ